MPRIAAPSVREHVERQEAAVIAAAVRLFEERGAAAVGLGDIAREVGLARNSLYRYFPDKAHVLAAWFRVTVAPLVEASDAIAAAEGPVADRLTRWVELQLDYLTAPDHSAMLEASSQLGELPEDVRAELGAGHAALYGSLGRIVAPVVDAEGRDARVVSMLVAALLRGAAEQIGAGADAAIVRAEVTRAALAVVGPAAVGGQTKTTDRAASKHD